MHQDGEMTDFALTAAIPASQTCTGTVAGQDNVCLVRCQNSARAGPFGGVVPVQMVDNAAGAGTGAGAGAGVDETGGGNGTTTATTGNGGGNNGSNSNASNNARKARRALAMKVRDNEMKLARLRRRAISLAEDLGDANVLAEVLEDCQ